MSDMPRVLDVGIRDYPISGLREFFCKRCRCVLERDGSDPIEMLGVSCPECGHEVTVIGYWDGSKVVER